jgi:hypothetical protein
MEGNSMKYSINLRMKNPGPAKYLLDSVEANEFMDAFHLAKNMADDANEEQFVEIFDNESKDVVATFNMLVGAA